jgi:histone arginine demethylase JMJD6
MEDGGTQIPSSVWFSKFYEKVTSDHFPYPPVHVMQRAGETVFVPRSWPHLVLNLELTVAVTHNYACEFGPLERMWKEVVTEEPEFAIDWLEGLIKHRPDLAQRIQEACPDTIPS